MPTEADWKRRVEERKKSEAPNRAQYDSLLQQAVVASDLLTSHPAWDVYLQRLQVRLMQHEADRRTWQDKIMTAMADADLRAAQMYIIMHSECIALLQYCMELPKEILSHAHDTLDSSNK